KEVVQDYLNEYKDKPVYVHLETTNGAYASHFGNKGVNVGAYIRNAKITYSNAVIQGEDSFSVGLNTALGWVYEEGLSSFELYDDRSYLLDNHDQEIMFIIYSIMSYLPFA